MTLCRPKNSKEQSAQSESANTSEKLHALCEMHRPIASLWRARLSIALAREKFGLDLAISIFGSAQRFEQIHRVEDFHVGKEVQVFRNRKNLHQRFVLGR